MIIWSVFLIMKKGIDKQYATENPKELDFLTDRGIKYAFVYRNDDDIRVFKYWKNKELFEALSDFYK